MATKQFSVQNTLQQREISWNQGRLDWLQIYLSNLRSFSFTWVHPENTSDSDFTWFLPKGILHRCQKQKKMQMLNITSDAIFSSLMLMLLFRKVSTKEEESTSPDLPSVATIVFHTCNYPAVFGSHCIVSTHRGNFAKLLRMTLKLHLSKLDLGF